jgi:hypothetical protein
MRLCTRHVDYAAMWLHLVVMITGCHIMDVAAMIWLVITRMLDALPYALAML